MTPSQGPAGERPKVMGAGRISAIVLGAQVAERFFGLVLAVAAANYLGAGRELDIALLALVVPGAVGTMLEGVAYVSLIPFFARARAAEAAGNEWLLGNRILNTATLAFAGLMVLYVSTLPWISRILARGYSAAELKQTALLGMLAAPVILLRGTGGTLGALLMTRGAAWPALGRFGARGLARVVFFVLLYPVTWGAMAFVGSAVAADVVAVIFCLPAVRGIKGTRPYQVLEFVPMRVLKTILSQAGNQSLISVFNSSVLVIERSVAAGLAAGSVAVLNYSRGLGLTPFVTGSSVVGGLYPRLAREAAADDPSLGDTAWRGLRAALFASLPVSVCLYIVREPMVAFFYQRGEFTERDVHLVASVMPFYLAGAVFRSVISLASRPLYSTMRAAVVARCEGVGWGTYLVTALALGPSLGVAGLGLAFAAMSAVSPVLLLWALRRHRLIYPRMPLRYAVHTAWSAVLTGLGAWAGYWLSLEAIASSSALGNAIHVTGGIAGGVVGYLPFALTAGRSEFNHLIAIIAHRPARGRRKPAASP